MSTLADPKTQAEFIALPKSERKRLAARRTTQRKRAQRDGLPLPPTYAEQFGTAKVKKNPPGSATASERSGRRQKVVKSRPSRDEAKEARKKRREESLRKLLPECGLPLEPPKPFWRTICEGMLHCTGKGVVSKYLQEAKKRGLQFQMQYVDGDRILGTVFAKGFTAQAIARLQAILRGTNAHGKFELKEPEPLV